MVKREKEAAVGNGYDGEKMRGYIEKIEGYFAEMESSKASHMNRCRQIRGSIDVVYEEAKALGIPKKVLKTHVDLRRLEERKRAMVEKLDDEQLEALELSADALGDFATLPLGMAALQREASLLDAEALSSLE